MYPARRIPTPASPLPEATLIIDSARRILGYSLDIAETVIDLESVRQAMELSTATLQQSGR
jgi:fumarylacetoacetate (FAA) hydrolase family protein